MEYQHSRMAMNVSNLDDDDDEDEVADASHHSGGTPRGQRALSVTPVNNEEINFDDTNSPSTFQIDENRLQQGSSAVTDMTPDANRSSPLTTTTSTIKHTDRTLPMHRSPFAVSTAASSLGESQPLSGRASPINGPGLAKPISVTSSSSSSLLAASTPGKKRIDVALEKNLETIVTQGRRTTTKPSQLTQNDLQLFDSAAATTTTGTMNNSVHSREMTPDSINTDSANEDQPQSVPNGHHYSRSTPGDPMNPYGQLPWPPAVYPFAHQHPGLYLPYPTLATPTNGLPFYPSYDPLFIEQHYNAQGLSAYYTQQQAAARLLHEHSSSSGSSSDLSASRYADEHQKQQQMMLLHMYRNQVSSVPPVELPPCQSSEDMDNLSSLLATPTNGHRRKKNVANNDSQPSAHHSVTHENLSRLSPDLSSEADGGGATNDVDSIISFESQKSSTAVGMPILEDGLSDSENISDDERAPPMIHKSNARHQSTQSASSTSLPKQKFAKSRAEPVESQASSFYIRPPPAASATAQLPVPSENSSTAQIDKEPVKSPRKKDYDTDEETDKLLGIEHRMNAKNQAIREAVSKPSRSREVSTRIIADPENSSVLIEGVLFRCRYLGSTQLLVEGNPTKVSRMMQAQEVVDRIKAPDGENQPSVDVDLFISTEKIMVLNTDLEDILMDHSLRSISYIADIGDLVVLMAKRRYLQHDSSENDDAQGTSSTRRMVTFNQKLICHVFESDEAQSIAHSIGQAFQAAYVEFLKANGIDDPSFTSDIDYQEVLDQQEIGSEELDRFSRKECQKEAIVTKGKNEPLGIVIVESGWGSMLPTVVVANMMPGGPAARGGQLNIGDQIISVNGISLVGLPLSSCQTQIKNVKHLTTVRLLVVPCPPVVEVLIRRPDTKYQLGFSVQNGIICSLLRGGIAERGGVRVGHRIIEINSQSVVATPHERIVNMLSHSIGELRMKTMPTQMYRLLTGQETPIYI